MTFKELTLGKLPLDLPLPNLDEIGDTYGLSILVNNTLAADDSQQPSAADIDIAARFLAAMW